MKDIIGSFVAVAALAVLLALLLRWMYPLVDLTLELAGLCLLVALLLKWVAVKLWSWRHKPAEGADPGAQP
jgi:hypothetical protein